MPNIMRMSRVMISSLNLVFERTISMWDREVKSVTLACVYYLGPKNTVWYSHTGSRWYHREQQTFSSTVTSSVFYHIKALFR